MGRGVGASKKENFESSQRISAQRVIGSDFVVVYSRRLVQQLSSCQTVRRLGLGRRSRLFKFFLCLAERTGEFGEFGAAEQHKNNDQNDDEFGAA